jgi:hypothetical protein
MSATLTLDYEAVIGPRSGQGNHVPRRQRLRANHRVAQGKAAALINVAAVYDRRTYSLVPKLNLGTHPVNLKPGFGKMKAIRISFRVSTTVLNPNLN